MHKDSKWARQIIAQQDEEGKWGWFHTLSKFYNSSITTEQALRRLECLGYTIEDECIQRAVSYMNDCLSGVKQIPDRREKVHDWDVITSLFLATWIRRFTLENWAANQVADQWTDVVHEAFCKGIYNHERYVKAYKNTFGLRPSGGRLVDFVSFYQISLLNDCLDPATEKAMLDYVIHKKDGIYYIYGSEISILPNEFQSKQASWYLGAVELLARYKHSREALRFVVDWLYEKQKENGKWDMGSKVNDKVYFPLSDD